MSERTEDYDWSPPCVDEDAEYERFVQRCDDGEQCGTCLRDGPLVATQALGFLLWRCPHCRAESIRIETIGLADRLAVIKASVS